MAISIKRNQFEHEVKATTRVFARDNDLNVIMQGDGACVSPDGKTIILPTLPDSANISRNEADVMRGFVDHETAHKRFTRLDSMAEIPEPWVRAMTNALEDMRIEAAAVAEYPGALRNIGATANSVAKKAEASIDAEPDGWNKIIGLAPLACTWIGRMLNGMDGEIEGTWQRCSDEVRAFAEKHTRLAMKAHDTDAVMKIARDAYDELQDQFKEKQRKQEQAKQEEQRKASVIEGDHSEPDDSEESDDSQSDEEEESPDVVVIAPDAVLPEVDASEEENEEDEEDEEDEEEDGPEIIDMREDKGASEDKEEVESKEDESKPSQEPGESSDADEGESEGEDNNSSVEDSENSGESGGESDDDIEGDNSEEGETGESSETDSDDAGAEPGTGLDAGTERVEPVKKDDMPGFDPDAAVKDFDLKEAVDDLAKDLCKPADGYMARPEAVPVYSTKLDFYVDGSEGDLLHNLMTWASMYDLAHKYDEARAEVGPRLANMSRKLERILNAERNARWQGDKRNGPRLDPRRIAGAYQRQERVWSRRSADERIDTAVVIMVDLSGSMSSIIKHVFKAVLIMAEAMERTPVRYQVMGFSDPQWEHGDMADGDTVVSSHLRLADEARDDVNNNPGKISYRRAGGLVISTFKGFDRALRLEKNKLAAMNYATGGSTPMYDGMIAAADALRLADAQRKIIMMCCDGQPGCMAANYQRSKQIDACIAMRRQIDAMGIEQVGIGLGYDLRKIFPRSVLVRHFSDVEKLGNELMQELARVFSGDNKAVVDNAAVLS